MWSRTKRVGDWCIYTIHFIIEEREGVFVCVCVCVCVCVVMETPLGVVSTAKKRRAFTELRPTTRRRRGDDDDKRNEEDDGGDVSLEDERERRFGEEDLRFGTSRRVPASASREVVSAAGRRAVGMKTEAPTEKAMKLSELEREEIFAKLQRARSDVESLERRREEDAERGAVQLRREVERAAESDERARVAEAAQREAQREVRSLGRQLEDEKASHIAERAKLEDEKLELAAELAEATLAAERSETARREAAFQADMARSEDAAAREALAFAEKRLQDESRLRDERSIEDKENVAAGAPNAAVAVVKSDDDVGGRSGDDGGKLLVDVALKREEELAALRIEVAEARKVKSQLRAQATLEEKLLDARARADRLGTVDDENNALRSRCEQLEQLLGRWTSTFQEVVGSSADDAAKPESAVVCFRALQADMQQSVVRQGELEARAASHETVVSALERRCADAEAAAAAARTAEAAAVTALKRCERKAGLYLKERDGLQAIIKSYEDETIGLGDGAGTPSSVLLQQLKEAEAALTEVRTHLHAAEHDLSVEAKTTIQLRADLERERRARADVDESVQVLQKELDMARREVDVYAARVGRGEFDPTKTKVLHFVHNPEAQTHKSETDTEIELLRAENDELRAQLKNPLLTPLNTPGGPAEGASAPSTAGRDDAVSTAVAAAEATILKRRVADLEKRENRYKSIFKEKITAFREACTYLFGYRIEMAIENENTDFVIRSIFSTDHTNDEDIRFRYRAGEGVELVPFDYSSNRELELNVKTFIHQFKCIPAFTANLTIESFNKTTVS